MSELKLDKPEVGDQLDAVGFVDMHCHCLAGMDDGPEDIDRSLVLCKELVRDGVRTVIATPHQLGRFENVDNDSIRQAVDFLNLRLVEEQVDLRIFPGAEVRLDERICDLVQCDRVMTMADSRKYILLELLPDIFVNIEKLVSDLNSMKIKVVIAHPERHLAVCKKPELLSNLFNLNVSLQVTAGSLLGVYGKTCQNVGLNFVKNGLVKYIASDAHDCFKRTSLMSEAFLKVNSLIGKHSAMKLFVENPMELLAG